MKDNLRFVDSDMHIMEPPDLFERYLDPKFRDRVVLPIGADGRPKRGTIVIDGLPSTMDAEMQQYRKRGRGGAATAHSTQPLSGSRLQGTNRLDFAIERNYDPEAQVMGMEKEGVDIAVLYPKHAIGEYLEGRLMAERIPVELVAGRAIRYAEGVPLSRPFASAIPHEPGDGHEPRIDSAAGPASQHAALPGRRRDSDHYCPDPADRGPGLRQPLVPGLHVAGQR